MTTRASPLLIDTDNITSVGTLTSLNISGNVTSGNATLGNLVTANYFAGSGANLTSIPAGNITGTVESSTISGTVTANAQPNITSTGTLTSLTVSGNTILGSIETINISGGSSGQFISTDGTGNLSFATVSAQPHPFLFIGI